MTTVVFLTVAFLIGLGMRTPDLFGGSSPKQQHRAIIEDTGNESQDTALQLDIFADVCDVNGCVSPEYKVADIIPQENPIAIHVSPGSNLPSRASPESVVFHA